ncbi:hypothetical protein [Mycoplasma simbae]|uniref:hypothetical protein n=1 Tax=Mycoplasma simbae TaxID=36744 RepID=UPI00049822E1|nr:hypothetical protein [Mycoplasma simbae]
MLKNIELFDNNGNVKQINFDKVNIFLGKKGSGKSTFLRIIAEILSNNRIFEKNKDFVESKYNIYVKKANVDDIALSMDGGWTSAIKSSSKYEENLKQLTKHFACYIVQNDDRKISLDETDIFKNKINNKLSLLVSEILKNKSNIDFLKPFENLASSINNYTNFSSKIVDFESVFDDRLNLVESKSSSISEINFSYNEDKYKLDKLKNTLAKSVDSLLISINNLINNQTDIEQGIKDLNPEFKNYLNKYSHNEIKLDSIVKILQLLHSAHTQQLEKINELASTVNSFEYSLKSTRKKQLSNLQQEDKINQNYKDLKDYFSKAPIYLSAVRNSYYDVQEYAQNVEVEWNERINIDESNGFSVGCDKFNLSEDDIKTIIKSFNLKIDNKTKSFWDLLKKLNLNTDISLQNIEKMIESMLKNRVELYINDKKYSSLSNGQRSIIGITETIKNIDKGIRNEYVLLDQVEDDLDSNTVVESVVPELKRLANSGKQLFIVTHNPNIGILLDGKPIVIDFPDENFENKINDQPILSQNDTPESFFLEGGWNIFLEREKILKKKLGGK